MSDELARLLDEVESIPVESIDQSMQDDTDWPDPEGTAQPDKPVEPAQPEAEAAKKEESTDDDTEDTSESDDQPRPDFTAREKASYEKSKRYKKQRDEVKERLSQIEQDNQRLQRQLMEMMATNQKPIQQAKPDEPAQNTPDLDPDEFITGKQISVIEERILRRMQAEEQRKQQEAQEYETKYLAAVGQVARRFYEDFEDVVVPVINQITANADNIERMTRANDPVKAAKMLYQMAGELNKPKQTKQTNEPKQPDIEQLLTNTARPQRANADRIGNLKDYQVDEVMRRMASDPNLLERISRGNFG